MAKGKYQSRNENKQVKNQSTQKNYDASNNEAEKSQKPPRGCFWIDYEHWDKLREIGIYAIGVVGIFGLLYNHWIGLANRIVVSILYVVVIIVLVVLHTNAIENSEKRNQKPGYIWFRWVFPLWSIFLILFFVFIGFIIPCLIFSSWSWDSSYCTEKGCSSPFYYQRGSKLMERYPAVWAPLWVKIDALPPLLDNFTVVIDHGDYRTFLKYTIEYDSTISREKIEKLFAQKTPEVIKNRVREKVTNIFIEALFREPGIIPEEVEMNKQPYNTQFATWGPKTDKIIFEVNRQKKEIINFIKKPGAIPGIKVIKVEFPILSE